jgi:hypothetical protein
MDDARRGRLPPFQGLHLLFGQLDHGVLLSRIVAEAEPD